MLPVLPAIRWRSGGRGQVRFLPYTRLVNPSGDARGAGSVARRPVIGQMVCGHRLLAAAGEGGFARVYRASAPSGTAVALKLLHDPDAAAGKLTMDREARVLTRLRHPGIVRLLDFGSFAGQPVLVLDWIDGETLRARLDRGPLAPRQAVEIALALLDALTHAHGAGVAHRDLKPSNVVLRRDGRPVLVDFGVATTPEDRHSPLRELGLAAGHLSYLAPERLTGDPDGPAADLYSVGVMLFEMLTGRRPFEGTPQQIVHAHLVEQVPSIGMPADRALTNQLDGILRRAMSKRPGDRFASAAAMRAALAAPVLPELAPPPPLRMADLTGTGPVVLPVRPRRRTGALALAIFALALALAGFSAAAVASASQDTPVVAAH